MACAGFFVLSGALSGTFVMDEKAGRAWDELALNAGALGVTLLGLVVLCCGELSRPVVAGGSQREQLVMR